MAQYMTLPIMGSAGALWNNGGKPTPQLVMTLSAAERNSLSPMMQNHVQTFMGPGGVNFYYIDPNNPNAANLYKQFQVGGQAPAPTAAETYKPPAPAAPVTTGSTSALPAGGAGAGGAGNMGGMGGMGGDIGFWSWLFGMGNKTGQGGQLGIPFAAQPTTPQAGQGPNGFGGATQNFSTPSTTPSSGAPTQPSAGSMFNGVWLPQQIWPQLESLIGKVNIPGTSGQQQFGSLF